VRYLIKKVDYKNKTFYCEIGNRMTGFYLTNRLSKLFLEYINDNVYVDFLASEKTKKINNKLYYQVLHFNEIYNFKTKVFVYNHMQLKSQMLDFLRSNEYFLFLDLEMTIPSYRQKEFIPEIVQYGLVLMSQNGKVIFENEGYIKPVRQEPISRRTLKFLSIDEEYFYGHANDYNSFYSMLRKIITDYKPKIVVWGKNDFLALDHSYKIHKQKRLTERNDFIDLLKLHKDYFNLRDDVGLFKAYETYYQENIEQVHNAKDDAMITKHVFDAFLKYIISDVNLKGA